MRSSPIINYIGIRLPGDRLSPNRDNRKHCFDAACSLVTYVKDVQQLGERELKALKMTVAGRSSPAKSAMKHNRSSSGKKVICPTIRGGVCPLCGRKGKERHLPDTHEFRAERGERLEEQDYSRSHGH